MNIALCICTRNRPEELKRALTGVEASTLRPVQTLVSDDSDEAQAARNTAVCAEFPWVTYLSGPRRGLSANRNNCLDQLTTEVDSVAFIDDDVVVRPEFFQKIAAALVAAPSRTIVTGYDYSWGSKTTPRNLSFWGHQEILPQGDNDYHTVVIVSSLFPRDLFDVARFDEALRYGSEEADICAQAEALGYRIQFCPDACNDHYSSPINRSEYAPLIDVARLYSTYKRYRWIERRPKKALAYALLAPLHLFASAAKSGRPAHIVSALRAVASAVHLVQAENLSRNALPGRPTLSRHLKERSFK